MCPTAFIRTLEKIASVGVAMGMPMEAPDRPPGRLPSEDVWTS